MRSYITLYNEVFLNSAVLRNIKKVYLFTEISFVIQRASKMIHGRIIHILQYFHVRRLVLRSSDDFILIPLVLGDLRNRYD